MAPPRPTSSDPSATTPSGRVLSRRGANTQQRLIEAGWQVFSRHAYPEARITEITAAAGVSTGSYYTYFDSKEELFRVIAGQALAEMAQVPGRDPDNPNGNPVRDIAYASRQFFLVCFKHRVVLRSIEQLHTTDSGVHSVRHSALSGTTKKIERWIRGLQAEGYCDSSLDAWYTATALQTMNVTLAYEQLVLRDDISRIDALVAAVTPIWARAVGLDSWLD